MTFTVLETEKSNVLLVYLVLTTINKTNLIKQSNRAVLSYRIIPYSKLATIDNFASVKKHKLNNAYFKIHSVFLSRLDHILHSIIRR